MNLKEVRTALVQRSGRYDLVVDTTDYVDNGADFFIDAGCRLLDRLRTVKKSYARYYADVAASDYYKIFTRCRAIQEVWMSNSDGRFEVGKIDLNTMKENYLNEPIADLDTGQPLYYAPAVLRTVPEQSDVVIVDDIGGTAEEVSSTEHYEYNGILWTPPADETYRLEVYGLFLSHKLSADADENHWSVNEPHLLIMAALYYIEVFNRNMTGAADWMGAIELDTSAIDKDLVEEETAVLRKFGG